MRCQWLAVPSLMAKLQLQHIYAMSFSAGVVEACRRALECNISLVLPERPA